MRMYICVLLAVAAVACNDDSPSNSNINIDTAGDAGQDAQSSNGAADGETICAAEGESCANAICCGALMCDESSSLCVVDDGDGEECPENISMLEGTACSEEGVSCGDCLDPCGFCNLIICEGGSWRRLEVFPDPTCGCAELGESCAGEPCCDGMDLVCDGESSQCVSALEQEVVCDGSGPVTFPDFARECTTHDDCAVVEHQIDCCGTFVALGIRADAQLRFEDAEQACREQYPGCGCASMPTEADDGTRFDGTREAQVACFERRCTSTFRLVFREVCEMDEDCAFDLGCCPPGGVPDNDLICMGLCDPEDEECGGGCPNFP